MPTEPERLPVGMPPLMEYVDGTAQFVIPSGDDVHADECRPVGDALDRRGRRRRPCALRRAKTTTILDADALPDARVLADDADRCCSFRVRRSAMRTECWATGWRRQASRWPRLSRSLASCVRSRFQSPLVLEGIAPIWADLDGDGVREILATLSDAIEGARVVVYAEDGSVIAEGPAVGQGNRWRHQIAVAPFGPQGELELAVVLTPHIGGVVEFYALRMAARDRRRNAGVHVACLGKPQPGYGGGGKPGGRRPGRVARAQPGSQPDRGDTSR